VESLTNTNRPGIVASRTCDINLRSNLNFHTQTVPSPRRAARCDESPVRHEDVIRTWYRAFNARDTELLLSTLHPLVELRPRPARHEPTYHGREEFRDWFENVLETRPVEITLAEVRTLDDERLVAAGSFGYPDDDDATPCVALYRMRDGKIVDARFFISDIEIMSKLGLLD
jgi:ketosteroid isomerase-like protein